MNCLKRDNSGFRTRRSFSLDGVGLGGRRAGGEGGGGGRGKGKMSTYALIVKLL